jgi:hypothetical protein
MWNAADTALRLLNCIDKRTDNKKIYISFGFLFDVANWTG